MKTTPDEQTTKRNTHKNKDPTNHTQTATADNPRRETCTTLLPTSLTRRTPYKSKPNGTNADECARTRTTQTSNRYPRPSSRALLVLFDILYLSQSFTTNHLNPRQPTPTDSNETPDTETPTRLLPQFPPTRNETPRHPFSEATHSKSPKIYTKSTYRNIEPEITQPRDPGNTQHGTDMTPENEPNKKPTGLIFFIDHQTPQNSKKKNQKNKLFATPDQKNFLRIKKIFSKKTPKTKKNSKTTAKKRQPGKIFRK